MYSSKYLVLAGLIINLAISHQPYAQSENEASNYSEKDCYVSGLRSKLRCYSLTRPLSDGSSETVTLKGVIVPADAVVPEHDPLIILAGGPGQAASDMVGMITNIFREINNSRDIIFFDIRGAGWSDPLVCESEKKDIPPLTHYPMERILEEIRQCSSGHEDKLRANTTKTAVADLEALRVAMGIEQFNIFGGSYGTRFGLYYLHSHPDRVRSAILDGLVPFSPSFITLSAGHALDVLNKVVADCKLDQDCSKAFPDFDPLSLLDQIKDGQEISYIDPVTGKMRHTRTTRTVVAQTLFMALYSPDTRVFIPYALTEAVNNNNWAPLSVLGVDVGKYLEMELIYLGALFSINCAEEKQNMNLSNANPDPFMNNQSMVLLSEVCKFWPHTPEQLPEPAVGSIDVPTYLISGGYDPVTPPQMAEYASKYFSNYKHFIMENGGHINSTNQCVATFLTAFVKDPDDEEIKPDCKGDGHVPAFVISPTGPFFREAAQ